MSAERRRRPRVRLAYQIRLRRLGEAAAVDALTENISSAGFYCVSEAPFAPGEEVDCHLVIPGSSGGAASLVLRRRARVLRMELRGVGPGFGLACGFENGLTAQAVENGEAVLN